MNFGTLELWVSSSQSSPLVIDSTAAGTADLELWVSSAIGPPMIVAVSGGAATGGPFPHFLRRRHTGGMLAC